MHALSPNLPCYVAHRSANHNLLSNRPTLRGPHRQAEPLVELRVELLLSREGRPVFAAFEIEQDGHSAGRKS
jgi:hypothetical protein